MVCGNRKPLEVIQVAYDPSNPKTRKREAEGAFSSLQRDWDLLHNDIKLNLVVSGSINRLMNRIFRAGI